jgi:beta-galactosidase
MHGAAHNPPSQALLDICDEAGMLMIAKRAQQHQSQAMDELERMIRASRNHPSIILWSVGNEEGHQGAPWPPHFGLVARAKALDPTRLTTQAMDNGWYEDGAARAVDVVGFNYRTDKIAAFKAKYPDTPVIGTETASTVATRGEYVNDAARHIVRAYDTEAPWWASGEAWWTIAADNPGIAGASSGPALTIAASRPPMRRGPASPPISARQISAAFPRTISTTTVHGGARSAAGAPVAALELGGA